MDRKALLTVAMAIALTIVTATGAVALNLGILDAPAADKVGELRTTPIADAPTTTNTTDVDPVTNTVASPDRAPSKTPLDDLDVSTTLPKASPIMASTTSKPKVALHVEDPEPPHRAQTPVAAAVSTTTEKVPERTGQNSGTVRPPKIGDNPGGPDDRRKGHDDDD